MEYRGASHEKIPICMIILCQGIKETFKEVISKHYGTKLSRKYLRKETAAETAVRE